MDKDPYLFDMLKEPSYLAAWKAMLAGEQRALLGRQLRQDLRRAVDAVQGRCQLDGKVYTARLGVQGA